MAKDKKGLYVIHEYTEGKFALCKVLCEYDTQAAVNEDLIALLSGKKSEKDLLKIKKEGL